MSAYARYRIEAEEAPDASSHPSRFRVRVRKHRLIGMILKELVEYRGNLPVVLSRPCVYGVFGSRVGGLAPREHLCVGCLRCTVQYPDIVQIQPNPDRASLGDSYLGPDQVDAILYEARAGRVPVRGAGYRGRFGGDGWDGMWTDMSEIVRPTRDGIHGREFISTAVEIGEKPAHLRFDRDLRPVAPLPRVFTLQVPFVFDIPPRSVRSAALLGILAETARRIDSLAIVPLSLISSAQAAHESAGTVPRKQDAKSGRSGATSGSGEKGASSSRSGAASGPGSAGAKSNGGGLASGASGGSSGVLAGPHVVPLVKPGEQRAAARLGWTPRLVFLDSWDRPAYDELSRLLPETILGVRAPMKEAGTGTVLEWVRQGVRVLHLTADYHGKAGGRFVADAILDVHRALVDAGLREEVTLIGSGGIVLAEHVPKAIICGLDAVGLDTTACAALQARFDGECRDMETSAISIDRMETRWAVQRLVNLAASWRDQLLEILGAMGLREVRRLRGETGRCMLQKELEREAFAGIEGYGS